MRQVSPRVFLVFGTSPRPGLMEYMKTIGCPEWLEDRQTEGVNNGDLAVEVGGRLCYRSWIPWDPKRPDCSNPNVEGVTDGNAPYIANILKQGHGSVFEHPNVSMIFHNISRVFTHELVRHRAGMGYSQESLRFVRLHDLKFWIPGSAERAGIADFMVACVSQMEEWQIKLAEMLSMDKLTKFSEKKHLTSLMRRLAPLGLATTIMATGNARAWRHILNMRASAAAEEEMQLVMPQVASLLVEEWPHILQDLEMDGPIAKLKLATKV
jgi:thymidylate synthase (FAD)